VSNPSINPNSSGKDQDDGVQVKPLAAILQDIAGGTFHTRLSEQMQKLVTAVGDTGKKGTLTVTLTVSPVNKGNTENLLVSGRTVLKAPESDAEPSSVFFTDKNGNLRRDDPNQPALPLRGLESRSESA
jgi:hypothetical protein